MVSNHTDGVLWEYRPTTHRVTRRGTRRVVYAARFLGERDGYRIRRTKADKRAHRKRFGTPDVVRLADMVEVHPHEWGA